MRLLQIARENRRVPKDRREGTVWRIPSAMQDLPRESGQALVEFALVLPILVLLLLGIVDFGRAWMTKQVVTNAAREGARSGIAAGATAGDVSQAVSNYLDAAHLTGTVSVNVGGVGPVVPPGTTTSVAVNYSLQTLSGRIIPGWTGIVQVMHTATMRHE